MEEDKMWETLGRVLGAEGNKFFASAIAAQAIKDSTVDLTSLAGFIKKYKVFSDEGVARFEKIVTDYFKELEVILVAEGDIAKLQAPD